MFRRYQEKAKFVSTQTRRSSRMVVDAGPLVPHKRRKSRIVHPFRRKFGSVAFSTVR